MKTYFKVLAYLSLSLIFLLPKSALADISGVTTTLGTSTVNTASTYTVAFTTGAAGALTAASNDTILITFPTNTTVPGSIAAGAQITVNGTSIGTAATGAGQTLTVTTPVDVANSTGVTVVINTGGSSIINPSTPSTTYQTGVSTNIESNVINSGNYTVTASATALSVGAVTVTPSTIGNVGNYSFQITTSGDGAITAGSSIVVTFPGLTTVPGAYAAADITVGGSPVATASGSGQAVTITSPIALSASTAYTIVFTTNAGIVNPNTVNTYTLTASTTAQTSAGTSPAYSIGVSVTPLTVGAVTVTPNTVSNVGQYSFDITTSADGALLSGSTIVVTFPALTTVPGSYSSGDITVGGSSVATASGSGQAVTITSPIALNASTAYTIVFTTNAGIVNPGTAASTYSLTASTAVQTTAGTSPTYTIAVSGNPLSVGAVTVNPNTISNIGQYSFNITTAVDGAMSAGGTILVTFPVDTTVPGAYAAGDITVGGSSVVTASGAGQVVTITSPIAFSVSTPYTIVFTTNAGIVNPSTVNTYSLTASTAVQTTAGTSPAYNIGLSGTALNVGAVTVSPNTIYNNGQYSFDITTGPGGAIQAGDSIVVTFPSDTTVPAAYAAGDITVGGSSVVTASAAGRVVTITSPIALSASTAYTIVFTTNADIFNPTTVTTYTLTASTTVQTTAGTSPAYNIGLSGTSVNVTSVVPSPATIGNAASYTILFDTAANGALTGTVHQIVVTFDALTTVSGGPQGGVTVGGVAASSATGNNGAKTVTITPAQNLAGGTSGITIFIPSTVLTNPGSSASYTLTVSTSLQPAGTSPLFAIGGSSTPVSIDSVTPSPTTIGNPAQYDVQIDIAADGGLVGGSSTITLVFPVGTAVQNGVIAGVTVEGTGATGATGNSATRTIVVTPFQSLSGGTNDVNIVIPSTALRNPTTVNTYQLTVLTSVQPVGTSPVYSIGLSATALTVDSATPNPNTIGNQASYNIQFDVAADGALVGGTSTITITFPPDTFVSNGVIGGVTVEGSAADSATGNTAARTIVVVPNQTINGGDLNQNIVIPAAALRNPTTVNTYQVTVQTSVQPVGTSPAYSIGISVTPLSVGAVTVNPNTITNIGQYSFDITTSANGAILAGNSIVVTFPALTTVPAAYAAGDITVGGTSVVTASGSGQVVTITSPIGLNPSTAYTIVFTTSAGIRNPATTGSGYNISAYTTVQTTAGTSPNYTIGVSSTPLSVGAVTVTPDTISNIGQYSFNITTSANGALLAGSAITVTFPVDTTVPAAYVAGDITVGGSPVAVASAAGRVVTITSPIALNASTVYAIVFTSNADIVNPTTVNTYSITASTAVQTSAGTSPTYSIGLSANPVNVDSASVTPNVVGNQGQYTIDFDVSADGGLTGGSSTLTLTFQANTFVTNGAIAGVTVEGTPALATGNSGSRTIIITPAQNLPGGTNDVTIVVPAVGVRNPTTANNYTLTVETSLQPAGTSPQYTITTDPTVVTGVSAVPSPNVVGNQSQYTISFNASANGALVGGASTITVTFQNDTLVSNGAIAGVTVEGVLATSASGNAGARTITIIPSQDLDASDNLIIIVIPSAGVRNPTTVGNYSLQVATSAQPNAGTSPTFAIGRSATSINVTSVVPNPNTIGNQAQYTINFNTSADGDLVGDASWIEIIFPAGTVVQNGAIGGVNVEGTVAFSANGDSATRTITVVPNQNIAGPFTGVTVVIPASAIRNPITQSAAYTLTVETSPQPLGTSPTYSIGLSGTPVNVTAVTPSPNTIGNQAQYTIDFNNSSDGALLGTVSTITVTFPADTVVQNGALAGVSVEGTPASSATGNSGARTVTIVPSQNFPGGTSAITLLIPSTVLRNPTSVTTYTLTVATSVQPVGTSPSYSIGQSASSVSISSVVPSPATLGNNASYTIDFTTSADGALLGAVSTITIDFPNDTSVTNGVYAGVLVNGTPATTSGVSASRRVNITVPANIAGSTGVTIFIPAAYLVNPTSIGNYSLTVSTSVQPGGLSPLYGIGLSGNNVNVTSVTPSPAVVGNLAAYTIGFTTSADGAVPAGGDIFISFQNDTLVPTGLLGGILINGVAPTTATGDQPTRRITLVPSVAVPASTAITVSIPLSASVRNPTTTGPYTLTVATSAQPAGTSPVFNITQSATGVNVTAVTPNPSTVGSDSQYTIAFSTSGDGLLYNGLSRIVVTFPTGTIVTTGAIGGITVNGTPPASATGSMAPPQIDLLIGADISASTAVTIIIPSSEIENPVDAGNYTLTVDTTAQPAGTSPPYAITISGTPLNVTAVAPSGNVVNTNVGYSVNFNPAVVLRANRSRIFLLFPFNVVVPGGAIPGVQIGGVPVSSATGNAGTRTINIRLGGSDVTPGLDTPVTIPGAIFMNPSVPGTHAMSVSTTAQPTGSTNYALIASSTTQISGPLPGDTDRIPTAPVPTQGGLVAQYTLDFEVGALGRLEGGNTISVLFPAGTFLPGTLPIGSITVSGIPTTSAVIPNAVGASTNADVLVPLGVAIPNAGLGTLIFLPAAGVSNPGQGTYQLPDIHTDAEPTPAESDFYTITADSDINTPTVSVSPDSIFANAEYTVRFRLGSSGSLSVGTNQIIITFPFETTMPATAIASEISVAVGTTSGTPVTTVRKLSNYTIEITSPINVLAGAPDKNITVVFAPGFGLYNPNVPGGYQVTVFTSIETQPIISAPYQINASTSTQITQPVVDLFPTFVNSFGRYEISFSTGAYGRLLQDNSSISIEFPPEFILPAAIGTNSILINGTVPIAAPTIAGQTLTITSPVDIDLNSPVTLTINSSAQIQNPPLEGSYAISLYTSSETTPVVSNAIYIRRSTWDDVITYPNPLKYSESTNKSFTFLFVPDQTATLKLYTLDGKLVKTIQKNDTTDRLVWYVNNERGQIVASGIYIYVIKGSSGQKRGKVGFLK